MVVCDDVVAEEAQKSRKAVPKDRRANVPYVHRLGHVWRTEVHNHRARLGLLRKEHVFTPGSRRQRGRDRREFQPEIKKPCPSDFYWLAQVGHVELGEDTCRELTGIELARFRQRHDRGSLVIPEFWVGTRPHEHGRKVGIRHDRAYGLLQAKLNLFVRQHGEEALRR
jgi:hypothetical protein